jgi:GAF domain-containing protein
MATYEVYIPATKAGGKDITTKVQADKWLEALSTGLASLGQTADVENVMVDVKATGVEVTEVKTGRVFRLSELTSDGVRATAPATSKAVNPIGRRNTQTRPVEEVLGELFEQVPSIYDCANKADAARFLLGLAMQSIPAESGSVVLADIGEQSLQFIAADGPKADQVLKLQVPRGEGVVGFCVKEGVALAVSDVSSDPHFYRAISEQLRHDTRSLLCSPCQDDGRVFGAIELINRTDGDTFSPDDINVLNYLAHEFVDYLINTDQA